MADGTNRSPVQQERAATQRRQQSAALFTQAQRDTGRAQIEFAQARAAAPQPGASAARDAAA